MWEVVPVCVEVTAALLHSDIPKLDLAVIFGFTIYSVLPGTKVELICHRPEIPQPTVRWFDVRKPLPPSDLENVMCCKWI